MNDSEVAPCQLDGSRERRGNPFPTLVNGPLSTRSIILSVLPECVMAGFTKSLVDVILESVWVPATSSELSLGSSVFYKKMSALAPFTP